MSNESNEKLNGNNSDAQPEGNGHQGETSELGALRTEATKFKNDFLYLRAEFDTYRRNVIKERADLTKYGSERLVTELLGVLDNFERAIQAAGGTSEKAAASLLKGVEMTAQEFRSVLQRFGAQEVATPEGANFDPTIHEALGSEFTNEIEPGKIIRVLRKAYKLHDKLIRPAQVVVARPPSPQGE